MLRKSVGDWQNDYLGKLKIAGYSVVGLGVTAFNRIGPALVYPDYKIFCFKNSYDFDALGKLCPIYSLEKEEGFESIKRLNSLSLIKHEKFGEYIDKLEKKPAVFLYRSSKNIWKRLSKMGLKIIANAPEIRDQFEEKKKFFKIGRKIGLPMIPGEQWLIDKLTEDNYSEVKDRIGEKLVFQLTDISMGGGKGTFFVNSKDDLNKFKAFVDEERKKRKLEWVNVTKFIDGPSPSITGCATRYGVLTGVVQTQVVDVPELSGGIKGRSGAFQGHDWSYKYYSKKIQTQAEVIAQELGEYMYKKGYRGIFGVDLVVDGTDKVYPVECNPRYTGAFPVYSMLQKADDEIPLDVFQLMEFLEIDYEMDFELMDRSWKQVKKGAHLILSNPYHDKWVKVEGDLSGGVYRFVDGVLEWVREGATYLDLENDEEVVLTDGTPRRGQKVKPGMRVGKLVFKKGVLESPGKLKTWALKIIDKVYSGYNLQQC